MQLRVLQPLLVGLVLVLAWPANLRDTALHGVIAIVLGLLVLTVDLPLTLEGYVWDMFVQRYEPDRFSPLLMVHEFLQSGGRLGVGALLAALAIGGVASRKG